MPDESISNKITLTPTDFGVGVQEVVLVKRFGGEPENADMPDSARRDLYRLAQETMPERELRFSVDVEIPGLSVQLVCRRLYHADGKIYRLVYLTKDAPDPRKFGPKPQDEIATLISMWGARHAFKTPPIGGVIMHYFFDPLKRNPIVGKYEYPVIFDEDRAESIILERLVAIRDAMPKATAELPECNEIERHSQKNDPYHKCRFYCRARTYCPQAKSVVHPDAQTTGGSALLQDDPGN
jgi:hypothetical protein